MSRREWGFDSKGTTMDLLLGAVLGVAFEHIFSFIRNVYITLKHWHVAGKYTHDEGVVRITRRLGNRFITDGKENNAANNWRGSFHFDDAYMRTGRGAYLEVGRKHDWGYHYIMLLENEDISVQWENMSEGKRTIGSLIWRKD
jgi:hypothetical protein